MNDPMLQHRRSQSSLHEAQTDALDPMSSLVTVELNLLDFCNRTCAFCPHADPTTYPNRADWKMSLEVTNKVGMDLASFGYKGRISYSGYGEPMLHKGIYEHVAVMRKRLPGCTIESNTNGDPLNAERIRKLFDAGMTYLYVNCYDGPHQLEPFHKMFREANVPQDRYRLRSRWKSGDGYAIVMNNRSGALDAPDLGHVPLTEPLKQPCAYTSFKLFVDWNGDVLGCSNDWKRTTIVGNILVQHLCDIWISDVMRDLRLKLFYGDRDNPMCRQCDVNGMLHSTKSMEILKEYYGWQT